MSFQVIRGNQQNITYIGISDPNTALHLIRFTTPLKFDYNQQETQKLVEALADFEIIYRQLPVNQIIHNSEPLLCKVANLFYEKTHINHHKQYPRDRIESYCLCYSIFGTRSQRMIDVKAKFDQTKRAIEGAEIVSVICFPENLENRDNWKIVLLHDLGADFNAMIQAHFKKVKKSLKEGNITENALIKTCRSGLGKLIGTGVGLGLSFAGFTALVALCPVAMLASEAFFTASLTGSLAAGGIMGNSIGGNKLFLSDMDMPKVFHECSLYGKNRIIDERNWIQFY